jgi:hypothetical protein
VQTDQHRPFGLDRADQAVIEAAAAELRHRAIQDAYTGLRNKAVAFSLALLLDELALHVRDLDDDVRRQAAESCQLLVR